MKNRLNLFKELKTDINWKTIYFGWKGIGRKDRLIEINEIVNYAIGTAVNNSDCESEVLEIASIYKGNSDGVEELLKSLSEKELSNDEIEIRKWILILLVEVLKGLSVEPLYGLIELGEFWSQFDYPDFMPFQLQGRGNNISPEEYYTRGNYEKVIESHRKYVDRELEKLND